MRFSIIKSKNLTGIKCVENEHSRLRELNIFSHHFAKKYSVPDETLQAESDRLPRNPAAATRPYPLRRVVVGAFYHALQEYSRTRRDDWQKAYPKG